VPCRLVGSCAGRHGLQARRRGFRCKLVLSYEPVSTYEPLIWSMARRYGLQARARARRPAGSACRLRALRSPTSRALDRRHPSMPPGRL